MITHSVLKSFSEEKVFERKGKYFFVSIFLKKATFALF